MPVKYSSLVNRLNRLIPPGKELEVIVLYSEKDSEPVPDLRKETLILTCVYE